MAGVGSESFVDVLSNTVGGLALLCILAALDAGNLRWRLFISEERPVATEAVRFVVREGRVGPFELDRLVEPVSRLPAGEHRLPASRDLGFQARIAKGADGGATIALTADPAFPGEPLSELLAGQGEVSSRLRSLDPDEQHVFFYLAPDAFEHYLAIRAHCRTLGLEIGWTPLSEPLRFSYGRAAYGGPGLAQHIEAGG